MNEQLGPLNVSADDAGIADVVFDRPPVNAVSIDVYEALDALVDLVSGSSDVRVVVLRAPDDARAWCGGADLHDFDGISVEARKHRYNLINRALPRFYELDRPVIAAINGHAIGIGMILAAACDMRVAADSAAFACPEIDFGLVAGGGGLFSWLKMPEGRVREMLFTGDRFTAASMYDAGFLNYVVAKDEVVPKARALAASIARKSLPAIRARKRVSVALEGANWTDAYRLAQAASAELTDGHDGQEGVAAFLEQRPARYEDA
jgi:enoyl-CoA hydratase/carnithine racemase